MASTYLDERTMNDMTMSDMHGVNMEAWFLPELQGFAGSTDDPQPLVPPTQQAWEATDSSNERHPNPEDNEPAIQSWSDKDSELDGDALPMLEPGPLNPREHQQTQWTVNAQGICPVSALVPGQAEFRQAVDALEQQPSHPDGIGAEPAVEEASLADKYPTPPRGRRRTGKSRRRRRSANPTNKKQGPSRPRAPRGSPLARDYPQKLPGAKVHPPYYLHLPESGANADRADQDLPGHSSSSRSSVRDSARPQLVYNLSTVCDPPSCPKPQVGVEAQVVLAPRSPGSLDLDPVPSYHPCIEETRAGSVEGKQEVLDPDQPATDVAFSFSSSPASASGRVGEVRGASHPDQVAKKRKRGRQDPSPLEITQEPSVADEKANQLTRTYQRYWCLTRQGHVLTRGQRVQLLIEAMVLDKPTVASFALESEHSALLTMASPILPHTTVGQQCVRDMALANSVGCLTLFWQRGWLPYCAPFSPMGEERLPLWCWAIRHGREVFFYILVNLWRQDRYQENSLYRPQATTRTNEIGLQVSACWDILTELVASRRLHWLCHMGGGPLHLLAAESLRTINGRGEVVIFTKYFELTGAQPALFPWRLFRTEPLLRALLIRAGNAQTLSFFDRLAYRGYLYAFLQIRDAGHLQGHLRYFGHISEMISSLVRFRALDMLELVWDLWMPTHLHTFLYYLEQSVAKQAVLNEFIEQFAHRLVQPYPSMYGERMPCPLCQSLSLCLYYVPMALLHLYPSHFEPEQHSHSTNPTTNPATNPATKANPKGHISEPGEPSAFQNVSKPGDSTKKFIMEDPAHLNEGKCERDAHLRLLDKYPDGHLKQHLREKILCINKGDAEARVPHPYVEWQSEEEDEVSLPQEMAWNQFCQRQCVHNPGFPEYSFSQANDPQDQRAPQ